MSKTGIQWAVVGAAFYLTAGATAEAAKGVKKVIPPNAQRRITGEVLGVTPNNGGATLHVRVAHHHKKRGQVNPANPANGANPANPGNAANAPNAAAAAGGNPHHFGQDFTVTPATRFEHFNGRPASLAALHRGERVRIHATGQQATNVHILSHHRTLGTFAHHRAQIYRPAMMQQVRQHNQQMRERRRR